MKNPNSPLPNILYNYARSGNLYGLFKLIAYVYIPLTCKNIDLFYDVSKIWDNDRDNKIREKCIVELFNSPDRYYNISKINKLNKNIRATIQQICYEKNITYDKLQIELIGGLKNYDFTLNCITNDKVIHRLQLEFKYGTLDMKHLPQFHSPHVFSGGNLAIFKSHVKGYHEYFYDNMDNFISCFPDPTRSILSENKPSSLKDYIKIMNHIPSNKHPYGKFQMAIYEYRKNANKIFEPDTCKINSSGWSNCRFQVYVKKTISDYLHNITIDDIDADKFNSASIKKQDTKTFILCKDGEISHSSMKKEMYYIKNDTFYIKNNNTIVFDCENSDHKINALLRWRNTHGCSNLAFQVSIL